MVNHIVEEDDLEEGLNKGRVDEVKDSWNAAYVDVHDPGTPRISFGAEQDIVVDRLCWTPEMLGNHGSTLLPKGEQICRASWTVFEQ